MAEQKLLKMLNPGIRWISSMDVHPSGDHLIVGGYDRKLCWFDLELSEKPYKILRYARGTFCDVFDISLTHIFRSSAEQISLSRDPITTFPSDISAVRIVVR